LAKQSAQPSPSKPVASSNRPIVPHETDERTEFFIHLAFFMGQGVVGADRAMTLALKNWPVNGSAPVSNGEPV